MKKVIFTIATFLFAYSYSHAQCYDKELYLGGTASYGRSWVDNLPGGTYKPSGQIGLSAITSRSRIWAWGANLTVSQMGFKWVRESGATTFTSTYLRLPVRGYVFFAQGRVRPLIYFGPEVGLKVGERNSGASVANIGDGKHISNWDAGLDAGAGFNIRVIDKMWIMVTADYYRGFTDVARSFGGSFNENRFAGVSLGVLHTIK